MSANDIYAMLGGATLGPLVQVLVLSVLANVKSVIRPPSWVVLVAAPLLGMVLAPAFGVAFRIVANQAVQPAWLLVYALTGLVAGHAALGLARTMGLEKPAERADALDPLRLVALVNQARTDPATAQLLRAVGLVIADPAPASPAAPPADTTTSGAPVVAVWADPPPVAPSGPSDDLSAPSNAGADITKGSRLLARLGRASEGQP